MAQKDFEAALARACDRFHLRPPTGAIAATLEALVCARESVSCVSPTGSGKTNVFLLFPFLFRDIYDVATSVKVIVISPLVALAA